MAGGMDATERNSAEVRVYRPNEDTWREWCPLPSPRHGFSLVDAGDGTERVFAVGGYGEDGPLAVVDVFGVGIVKATGEDGKPRWPDAKMRDAAGRVTVIDRDYPGYDWWPGAPLAQPRGFFGLAKLDRTIFAVGGRRSDIPRTEVLDIDAVTAGWEVRAPLPKDLCRFSLVAWNGRLLAFGGETDYGKAINTDVLEYDPALDVWTVR